MGVKGTYVFRLSFSIKSTVFSIAIVPPLRDKRLTAELLTLILPETSAVVIPKLAMRPWAFWYLSCGLIRAKRDVTAATG
jgi:hypothetical protein